MEKLTVETEAKVVKKFEGKQDIRWGGRGQVLLRRLDEKFNDALCPPVYSFFILASLT
jgi:hypothetical protein